MNKLSMELIMLRRNDVDHIEETCQLARELDIFMEHHKLEMLEDVQKLNALIAKCHRVKLGLLNAKS